MDVRGGVEHVLEAVEHEERPFPLQRPDERLERLAGRGAQQRRRDLSEHAAPVLDRVETDPRHAVREVAGQALRELDRKARLPDSSRPDDGEQPHVRLGQHPGCVVEVLLAADERRRERRQRDRLGVRRR